MSVRMKIGIIGGTGLDDPDILEGREEKSVTTPFGKPSDVLIIGKIKGVDCVLLARHGRRHSLYPSAVNYRANIHALKAEGCTHLVVTTACGSLRENLAPGDFVVIDQFIDREMIFTLPPSSAELPFFDSDPLWSLVQPGRTTKRAQTFYDGTVAEYSGVCHIPMAKPFCAETGKFLMESMEELGITYHKKGTMVTIEGPRFSSQAESHMFRAWGADVINMTTAPEVVLAAEAGLSYAAVALVTDFDCWKESEHVSVETVLKILGENSKRARQLLLNVIPKIASKDWTSTVEAKRNMATFSVLPQ